MPRGETAGGEKGGGRVPPDEAVVEALLAVLKEVKMVRSQERLLNMVEDGLKKMNEKWGITAGRLRRLASQTPGVKIIAHCRVSHTEFRGNRCPVCGETMKPIRNQTLYGWKVTAGYSCPRCSYWTGKRKRIPILYEFIYEEKAPG